MNRSLVLALAVALQALSTSTFGAAATAPVLDSLFKDGVRAYDAQDFAGAIAAWEKLQHFRVASVAVEYNLGNAYFKKKEYGRAVLHWERAIRLDPSDEEVLGNLRLVRELLVDDVPPALPPLAGLEARVRRLVTPDEAALAAFAAWQVLGLGLFAVILANGALRRAAVAVAVIAAAAFFLAAPVVALEVLVARGGDRLVVIGASIEVRSGPGEQYATVFTVHEGLVVAEREAISGWSRVQLASGLNGWVARDAVERI